MTLVWAIHGAFGRVFGWTFGFPFEYSSCVVAFRRRVDPASFATPHIDALLAAGGDDTPAARQAAVDEAIRVLLA